ncbi:MAG: hypothetical protein ACTSRA_01940, partial [Promethearchaeota archaeon]
MNETRGTPRETVIVYKDKTYIFNIKQIILLGVATPLLTIILYYFLEYAFWIRYIVAEQTINSLNFITGMGATMYMYDQDSGNTYSTFSELVNHVGWSKIYFSHV